MSGPPILIPTAEPFFFPAGETACLLVHGFTATPKEMRWMGEYLHGEGFTVLGVRLAGHATDMRDLARMRWWDWLASVEDGWHLLRSAGYGPIFVMGLSLGGALSLLFAARHPVAGVVSISAPYCLKPYALLPILRPLALVKPFLWKGGPPDLHDPVALRERIAYPANPTRAVAEVRDLLVVLRDELPHVRVPVLLAHSRRDTYVPPRNMEQIYAALGTDDKAMLWLTRSSHIVTRDVEREVVFRAAADFVRRVTAQRQGAAEAPPSAAGGEDKR